MKIASTGFAGARARTGDWLSRAAPTLLLVLLALPHAGASQDPAELGPDREALLGGAVLRVYRTQDGLPSNWIYDLLQSRDGYVWIGTQNGLARFDGSRFTVFNTRNTPELPGNNTRALCESRDGSLWIGSHLGLARYRPGRPGTFEGIAALRGVNVRGIYEDCAGDLWVGAQGGLWLGKGGVVFEKIEDSPTELRAVCEDETGTLWLGSDHGLFVREGDRFVRTAEEWLPARTAPNYLRHGSEVASLHRDDQGLWIGTQTGLLLHKQGRFEPQEQGIARLRIHAMMRSSGGTLYAGVGMGLARSSGTGFDTLSTQRHVNALLEDREGGLWIGLGGDAGLCRYQRAETGVALTDRFVNCIREDRRGRIWLGTEGGLVRLDGATRTEYGLEQGLLAQTVRTIAPGVGDTLWIGTAGGLVRWDGEGLTAVTQPPELVGMHIRVALEDRDGVLWLARWGKGTYFLKEGQLHELEELRDGATKWFHEDAEGRVWVGHQSGLWRGETDRLERVTDSALERIAADTHGHYAAPNGDLWIATTGGIARHRSGVFDAFTVRNGLAAEFIERLSADHSGNLWLGGRHGFCYVSLDELDDVAAGRALSFTSHAIARDQGMSTLSQGHGFPNTCLASDGTLWLGAARGVVKVPAEPQGSNSVPPELHVERVRVDGETVDATGPFAFTSGAHRLSIEFATPSFRAPERVRARYRLDGHDPDWIEAGRERVAHYTSLPPGEYTFRLVAENEDSARTSGERTLSLRVRPRWWERTWLRVGAAIGLLASVVLFFRMRARGLLRRNAELQHEIAERERAEQEAARRWEQLSRVSRAASMGQLTTSIAHEVKQPLFAIVSNAQTATRLLKREPLDRQEVREALQDIASDGNRASDIIDHVRSLVRREERPLRALDLSDLARDVIRLVEPELRRRDISLRSDLADDLPAVAGDRVELQQVLINLILNGAQAMEHTERSDRELALRTHAVDGSVAVAVRDRGVGLDEAQAAKIFEPFFTTRSQGIGMGLAINRAIIERHGGQIRASSNPGPGATFEFSLRTCGEEDA